MHRVVPGVPKIRNPADSRGVSWHTYRPCEVSHKPMFGVLWELVEGLADPVEVVDGDQEPADTIDGDSNHCCLEGSPYGDHGHGEVSRRGLQWDGWIRFHISMG